MHALPHFRCSELDRTFRCHGWRVLAKAPAAQEAREEDSEDSVRGTWGHYLIARWALLYMQAYAPKEGLPHPRSSRPEFSPIDKWALKFCTRELQSCVDMDMALEVEAELSAEFPRFLLSGHIDALGINATATRAKCWDWKLGRISVDAADANNQVLGYLVLLFLAYETLREITFYLVQPFSDVDDGYERVTEVSVTRDQFPALLTWITGKIHEALDDELTLDSGAKQCRRCPCPVVCPAALKEEEEMTYKMTRDEVDRITSKAEDIEELVSYDQRLQALSSIADAVRTRLRHRVHKMGKATVLADGRRVYLKKKCVKRFWDCRGREQFDLVAGTLGEGGAMDLFNVSVKKVEEAFGQSEHARRADGTSLPKTSKKGPSVESEFSARFGTHVRQNFAEILHIDPPEAA